MTKKPSYRFVGYTEPWEEKKLGEVSTHRSGTSIEKYFAGNGLYKVISIGSYGLDGEYIDQGIRAISNEVTDKKIVKENELTMVLNDKTSNGTIIGRTLLIKSSNEFVVNQRTEIISPKEILDSQYAYVLLNGNFREQVKKIVQGGTQIYVNYSSVEQLKLSLPSLPEQTAIGSFFQDIDQLISLQQRKLEVLKEQKKTYLKLLFPAKGQTKPAFRFTGFEGDWKEVKLGEVTNVKTGGRDVQDSVEDGLYPFYIRSEEVKRINSYSFDGEAILIPGEGRLGEIFHYVNGKFDVHQRVYKISNFTDINAKFVLQQMKKDFKQHAMRNTVKATVDSLRLPTIQSFTVFVPTLPEQEAIGSFFQNLDKSIAKQEEKVNQLKESKQTLLRKMFI